MLIPALCTSGSLLFFAASILLHPTFSSTAGLYVVAVCGFIAGAMLFTVAGGLGLWHVLRERAAPMAVKGAAVLSLLGAMLLLAGSTAFLPAFAPRGATIGTYTFRGGSISYVISSAWSLVYLLRPAIAARRLSRRERRHGTALLTYIGGALFFIAGGACFLRQNPGVGSLCWAVGSGLFLLGSATYLSEAQAA